MVLLLASFEDLKAHYETYPVLVRPSYRKYVKDNVEFVSIMAGQYGWKGKLDANIEKWLKEVKAIEIIDSIPDELFFMG
jgi:hypothetical protein